MVKLKPKIHLYLIAIITILFLITSSVYASSEKRIIVDVSGEEKTELNEVFKRTNSSLGLDTDDTTLRAMTQRTPRNFSGEVSSDNSNKILEYTGNELVVYTGAIQESNPRDVDKVLNEFFRKLEQSALSRNTKANIGNRLENSSPDIKKAYQNTNFSESANVDVLGGLTVVSRFFSFFSLIMGILSIVTVMLLTVSTVLDIMFIGLPVFRDGIINYSKERNKSSVFLISDDAVSVIYEVEKDLEMGTKNPYLIYLRKRFITYIVFFACLMYLVMGGAGNLVSIVMNFVGNAVA